MRQVRSQIPQDQKSAYYCKPAILIQFTLREIEKCVELIERMESKGPHSKETRLCLESLGGPKREERTRIPWFVNEGRFRKLRDYCGTLLAHKKLQSCESLQELYWTAEKSWVLCKKLQETLREKEKTEQAEKLFKQILRFPKQADRTVPTIEVLVL